MLAKLRFRYVLYPICLFALVFTLTACGGTSGSPDTPNPPNSEEPSATTPPTTPPNTGKVLGGTVEGWISLDAVVRADTYNSDNYIVYAEQPIDQDGTFSVALPIGEQVDDGLFTVDSDTFCGEFEFGEEVSSTIEVTPSLLDLAQSFLYVYPQTSSQDDEYLGYLVYESDSFFVAQLYAASNATVQGTCTYTAEYEDNGEVVAYQYTDTYNLNLTSGWNDIIATFTEEDGLNFSTGPIPEVASWQYYPTTTSSQMTSSTRSGHGLLRSPPHRP